MALINQTVGPKGEKSLAQAASLFETFIIVDHLRDAVSLNEALRAVITQRMEDHEGVRISNIGGWHSDTHMLAWGGEAARTLCERIIAAADQYTVDVKSEGKPRYKWFPEMWANVTPRGAFNREHCHPGSFWSAVYYVDDGYGGSADRDLGGELVLLDPRMPMIRMNAPDLRFRRPGQPVDHHENTMRPVSGRLVIFPSWLSHAVRAFKGGGTRISVAVNLSAVPVFAHQGVSS